MFANLDPTLIAMAVLGGYLVGSIPFGVIVTRLAGAGDLRQIGSGNIGATNVLRTGRKGLALVTLVGDGGKGALAVLGAWLATRGADPLTQAELVAVAAGAAFLGHLFPVWLGFRGGKGVATFLGVMLAAAWPAGLLACATWLVVARLSRFSSLAALTAAALTPAYVLLTGRPLALVLLAFVMGALIFIRHRDNIIRLRNGAEPRIGGSKPA